MDDYDKTILKVTAMLAFVILTLVFSCGFLAGYLSG